MEKIYMLRVEMPNSEDDGYTDLNLFASTNYDEVKKLKDKFSSRMDKYGLYMNTKAYFHIDELINPKEEKIQMVKIKLVDDNINDELVYFYGVCKPREILNDTDVIRKEEPFEGNVNYTIHRYIHIDDNETKEEFLDRLHDNVRQMKELMDLHHVQLGLKEKEVEWIDE